MKNFRITKQKQIIQSLVSSHCDHPTADEIYFEARLNDAHISRGTVYRNLEKLCETDELLRIKVPGEADRFDGRLDYHYHIVCSRCGKVEDAPIAYNESFDEKLSENTDYIITRHRTVFEGLCPLCSQKQNGKEER